MSGERKTNIEIKNEKETIRIRTTKDGRVFYDHFRGDVENPKEHDRFTVPLNDGVGRPSGHDYDHKKWK